MIPPAGTGLVQPLDISENKSFKNILQAILEDHLNIYEAYHQVNLRELHQSDLSAIAERRILVTHPVGEAWEKFNQTYQELVVTTFRNLKLGLIVPIDGSCDHERSIKGKDPSLLTIGNWRIEGKEGLDQEVGEGKRVFHWEMDNEQDIPAGEYVDWE